MDLKDKKIIYELRKNTRASITNIAKKVNLSKELTNYRIKKLIKSNLINLITVPNLKKAGLNNIGGLFIRFYKINKEKEDEIISYLKKHPNTINIITILGKFDLLIATVNKDLFEFNNFFKEFINKYGRYILNLYRANFLNWVSYGHELVIKGKLCIERKDDFGIKTKKAKIDGKDIEILKILENNARTSLIEIASKLKTSSESIRYKINRMVKENIIDYFDCTLNFEKFELHSYYALLRIDDLSDLTLKKLDSYFRLKTQINGFNLLDSEYTLLISLIVKNQQELYNVLTDLKEKFGSIIKDYEILIPIKLHKYNQIPEAFYLELKSNIKRFK